MLSVKQDTSRPGGGYAILSRGDISLPNRLAFEDRSSGSFLGDGGRWSRQPRFFEVDDLGSGSVRLGPDIADHIPADTLVAVHAQPDGALGTIVWPHIRPSAGLSQGEFIAPVASPRKPPEVPPAAEPPPPTPPPPTPPPPAPAPSPPAPAPAVQVAQEPPVQVAPLPDAASRGSGWRKWALGTVALILLAGVLVATMRNTDYARQLVCEASGPLHGNAFAQALVPCQVSDAAAYESFLRCSVGKDACAARSCARSYFADFERGPHSSEVRTRDAQYEADCKRITRQREDFDAFKACIAATPDSCGQHDCVERFQDKLGEEPYASQVRQKAQQASEACSRQQEDDAFSAFSRCIIANPCGAARQQCARAFISRVGSSPRVALINQIARDEPASCRPSVTQTPPPPPPGRTPGDAAKDFVNRIYYVSSTLGQRDGLSIGDLYASSVQFYGQTKSRSEIEAEKRGLNDRWDVRRFKLEPDSYTVTCEASGSTCRVTGRVIFDFDSTSLQRSSRGVSSFQFTIQNPASSPRIVAEDSKVERRF